MIPHWTLVAFLAALLLYHGTTPAGESVRIGLALPTQQEERWVRDMHAMKEHASTNGVDLLVAISRNDQQQQNQQVDDLLDQGIRVLILAPHDSDSAGEAVAKARERGVSVISYDRLIVGAGVDLYISFDNVGIGEQMGRWLAQAVPAGKYIIMSGAPTDNNAAMFKEGQMRILQPLIDSGAITVLADEPVMDWKPVNAQKIVESILDQPDIWVDAILAPNDGTAAGAIAALQERGLAGTVPVTGMDAEVSAVQRILEGTQSFTIFKDTRKLAKEALRLALHISDGRSTAAIDGVVTVDDGRGVVPALLLATELVDKDSVETVLFDSGYMQREDVAAKG